MMAIGLGAAGIVGGGVRFGAVMKTINLSGSKLSQSRSL